MLLNFSSTLVSGITFLEAVGIFSPLPWLGGGDFFRL